MFLFDTIGPAQQFMSLPSGLCVIFLVDIIPFEPHPSAELDLQPTVLCSRQRRGYACGLHLPPPARPCISPRRGLGGRRKNGAFLGAWSGREAVIAWWLPGDLWVFHHRPRGRNTHRELLCDSWVRATCRLGCFRVSTGNLCRLLHLGTNVTVWFGHWKRPP